MKDGSAINTHKQWQVHWDKFEKAKESGETHLMDSKVVDSEDVNAKTIDFEDVLNESDCEKGFRFCIVGAIETDQKVVEDLRGMENHVINQLSMLPYARCFFWTSVNQARNYICIQMQDLSSLT